MVVFADVANKNFSFVFIANAWICLQKYTEQRYSLRSIRKTDLVQETDPLNISENDVEYNYGLK